MTGSPVITDTDKARVLDRLLEHLRARPEVQNIDLMNLADFCRNCLSNWLQEAQADRGITLEKSAARSFVYGMPYEQWQATQKAATPEQLTAFEARKRHL